jgi:3-isopropylmalate dehydrogenase
LDARHQNLNAIFKTLKFKKISIIKILRYKKFREGSCKVKSYKIALLKGDGIGPEVTEQTVLLFHAITKRYGQHFEIEEGLIGGTAIDTSGDPLPQDTINLCKNADAVLLGAVGGPKWDNLPGEKRPESGLLRIRQELGLYANLRPAIIYPSIQDASPLKSEIINEGIDIMVVRELTGGMYFGKRGRGHSTEFGETAFDTEEYSVGEVERIVRLAFEIAKTRNKNLVSIDKANVLESSRLWRSVVLNLAKDFPDVTLNHMYVDNAAMQLVRNPSQFDVLVTTNMFGDILSDQASMITGSIGMLPSASLGKTSLGLYEPIHGSAPDIAGKNIANPLATLLSIAMMMRYSFHFPDVATDIETAVNRVLEQGLRTADIAQRNTKIVGTTQMAEAVCKEFLIL